MSRPPSGTDVSELCVLLKRALEAGDLDRYSGLLAPDVRWGPPGDASSLCQSRRRVLEWYRRGHEQGRRARNVEVTPNGNKLLVSMQVSSSGLGGTDPSGMGRWVDRWQVLSVDNGRITDIRGYELRDDAVAALGTSP